MRVGAIRRCLAAASFVVALGVAAGTAMAAVPPTLTQQGRLYDASDLPINATLDVTFAVYDAPAAAAPIWSETLSVTFEEGYFAAQLGQVVPFGTSTFDGSTRYLGITIEGTRR
jgi:hypothetical protein